MNPRFNPDEDDAITKSISLKKNNSNMNTFEIYAKAISCLKDLRKISLNLEENTIE